MCIYFLSANINFCSCQLYFSLVRKGQFIKTKSTINEQEQYLNIFFTKCSAVGWSPLR